MLTIQNWLFYNSLESRSVVAICHLFQKNGTICLEVLLIRTTFVGFDLSWKTHRIDWFTFELIYMDPRFITYIDVIHGFWHSTIVFLSISLHQSILVFCVVVKLCSIQRAQIFFTSKCSCKILGKLVILLPRHTKILQYVTWRTVRFVLSVRTQHRWFVVQQSITNDLL